MDLSQLRVAGWRGGDLLTLGLVYLGVAVSVILAPNYQPDLVHTHLPVPLRVAVWAAPGLVAVVCGWAHSRRLQGIAFGLLSFAPAERMTSFFWGATFYHGADPQWWPGFVVYAGFLLFVLRLAARPEPVEPAELPAVLRPEKLR